MIGLAAPNRPRTDMSWLTEWRRTLDWPIVGAALSLMALGLLLALAAGPPAAARIGLENSYHFVWRQAVFAVGAGVLLIAASLLDRDWVRRAAAALFLVAVALMGFVLLGGAEVKGAQRWIAFAGLTLQPSELVKPALVVLAGWLLAQRHLFPHGPWAALAFSLFAATIGLLLLQPDVGQAVLLTMAFVLTFFVSGLPWRWAAGFGVGGMALAGLVYASLDHVRRRVNAFLDPSAYDTYQIDRALEALRRGGFWGVGPGEGTVKASLPDAHTDFIFAVLGEEYGLIAGLAVMALYGFIVVRGILAAARLGDGYARAAAVGLFALFGLQAAINLGVNVALLPPKGMTLPLMSYGGSSLAGTALTLGFALALIRRRGLAGKAYG